jgi:hypothetical protein
LAAGRRCSSDVAALEHVLVVGDGRDEVVVLQVLPHVTGLVLPGDEEQREDLHCVCKKINRGRPLSRRIIDTDQEISNIQSMQTDRTLPNKKELTGSTHAKKKILVVDKMARKAALRCIHRRSITTYLL